MHDHEIIPFLLLVWNACIFHVYRHDLTSTLFKFSFIQCPQRQLPDSTFKNIFFLKMSPLLLKLCGAEYETKSKVTRGLSEKHQQKQFQRFFNIRTLPKMFSSHINTENIVHKDNHVVHMLSTH